MAGHVCLTGYCDYPITMNHFHHLTAVTPVRKMSSAITGWIHASCFHWIMNAVYLL